MSVSTGAPPAYSSSAEYPAMQQPQQPVKSDDCALITA